MNILRAVRGSSAVLAAAAVLTCFTALAADPDKVLRVEIPRSETGFDPMQASEIYSSTVIAAIGMRKRPKRYRPVQGMIGTAEIAFIGEPSSTRLLIAT